MKPTSRREECFTAESVPDELLPLSDVSAKLKNDGPPQKKESDRQKKQTTAAGALLMQREDV